MIDPADMAPINALIAALDARLTAIEAELTARRGTMQQRVEPEDARPMQFTRGKRNAPPHGEPGYDDQGA